MDTAQTRNPVYHPAAELPERQGNDNSSERVFAPLDWAMSDSGCTEIQCLNNGSWETL